jgi:hypothetical protein
MCTIAVSGLGHLIEAAGVSTVVIGLVPQHLEAMRPPRALAVPFELGRPFGAPHDASLQRATLSAALALLDRQGPGPILDDLDVEVPDAAGDEPWVCPVSFPQPEGAGLAGRLQTEIRLLMPWFERGRTDRGFTATGLTGLDIEAAADWLAAFLEDPMPTVSPAGHLSLADCFKLAAEELKAYYLEAATAPPGQADHHDIDEWFWDETAAGEFLWRLREQAREHDDEGVRLHATFTLIPETIVRRRKND